MYPSNKLLWSYDLKRRSVLDLLENLHMWIRQIPPTFLAISWMWQIQYKLLTHEKTWSFWTRCNLNLISSTEILIPITLVYHRWRLIHEPSYNRKDLKYGYHVNEDNFKLTKNISSICIQLILTYHLHDLTTNLVPFTFTQLADFFLQITIHHLGWIVLNKVEWVCLWPMK